MLKVKLNNNFNQQTEIVLSLKYFQMRCICDRWLKTKMNKIISNQQNPFVFIPMHKQETKSGVFI